MPFVCAYSFVAFLFYIGKWTLIDDDAYEISQRNSHCKKASFIPQKTEIKNFFVMEFLKHKYKTVRNIIQDQ